MLRPVVAKRTTTGATLEEERSECRASRCVGTPNISGVTDGCRPIRAMIYGRSGLKESLITLSLREETDLGLDVHKRRIGPIDMASSATRYTIATPRCNS